MGRETGRLPREKGLGEIPQGASPRKLARSPAGKRVVSQPIFYFYGNGPNYIETYLQQLGS
ncbi:hypothetical protein GCM10007216_00510 [Thalassobacillus devorans]|uniref:Uncharacterized protein n=1 Tax=Thalassobacillus devorans TaxID=279813 RepID=A0ABQ1NDY0_9BACI|nr:hypothetical protein GCM10007216_00510 [Thalassobacillus devorans]